MKIIFLIPSNDRSAPNKIALSLHKFLLKKRINSFCYYLKESKKEKLRCKNFSKLCIRNITNFSNASIIHSHMALPDLLSFFVSFLFYKPVYISTLHCDMDVDIKYDYSFLFSKLVIALWKISLFRFNKIITLNENLVKKYSKFTNVIKIYNGIKINSKSRFRALPNKKKVLCTVANLNARKGHLQIIKAVKNINVIYKIYGDGLYKNFLEQFIRKNNITNVYFFGHTTDLVSAYSNVDLAIVPSYSEAFGLSLIEAVNFNVPVLCSDIQTFRELFNTNEVTFFQIDNIPQISNLLSCENTYSLNKCLLAKRKLIKNYSENLMCKNYYNLYEKILHANY